MHSVDPPRAGAGSAAVAEARRALDAHVREIVDWHFDPATGAPFWLDYAQKLGWDPRKEIAGFDDLNRLGPFEDEWLRGGPLARWVPRGLAGKPVFVFETGGTTGIPKSRISCDDFRTDYQLFSSTLADEYLPKGANWLMVPGLEVLHVEWSQIAPGQPSRRVLQLLPSGDTLEIRFAAQVPRTVADPLATLVSSAPLPGWSQVVKLHRNGWLVARAPISEEELEALVARAGTR